MHADIRTSYIHTLTKAADKRIHTYTQTYIHIHTLTNAYIHAYIHIHTDVHTYDIHTTYIHTYMHTYIPSSIFTQILKQKRWSLAGDRRWKKKLDQMIRSWFAATHCLNKYARSFCLHHHAHPLPPDPMLWAVLVPASPITTLDLGGRGDVGLVNCVSNL